MTQLLEEYRRQKAIRLEGNLYHKTQVELAYNSNRIEGSRLSADQTRQIFETRTVSGDARLDDIAETENHFKLFDLMLDTADEPLAPELVRAFHRTLKQNTAQAASDAVFEPGAFKSLPNEVGGILTVAPEAVESELGALLASFDEHAASLEDIADFHWRFECIHPFQDGNGRVGRMLMFRSCLVAGVVPFIVALVVAAVGGIAGTVLARRGKPTATSMATLAFACVLVGVVIARYAFYAAGSM